jgi:transcriptional regulator with GAF, ATPase, and Fis domain
MFVDVNCAGLPENLIESELFGHCKGAFTGALIEKKGLWLQAQNGTLFLDEIGDFPLGVQAKLLRALQQREIRAVGATINIPVNARIVCATHKPIEKMVEDGRFREDLYHRLTTFDLRLTPLEDRPDDIPLILEYIARKYEVEHKIPGDKKVDIDKLHVKPKELKGNVRTLERVIERYYVLGELPI